MRSQALWLRVLRALLPSWRFFDEIEPAPTLTVRLVPNPGEPTTWFPVALHPPRGLLSVLFNARGNLALANASLLEQLLSDVAEPSVRASDDVEQLTSYLLVTRLARSFVRAQVAASATHGAQAPGAAAPSRFQFKLTLAATAPDAGAEDVLVSREHEV